jgi:hypothetical protein
MLWGAGRRPARLEKPNTVPNAFAYLMLVIWPVVTVALFRQTDPRKALIWTILAGYLLLPPVAGIDLPVVPDLDKFAIPSLMAMVCLLAPGGKWSGWLPESRLARLLIVVFVLSPLATALTNDDPLSFLQGQIPGMTIYDALSAIAYQMILLLPLFMGRRLLGDPEGLGLLAHALIAAGLAYSLPMLIEAQLSPQINVWVYGFFQHDFFQTIRNGGYRPVVFLPHGLWVAFFTLMSLLSALIVLRMRPAEERPRALVVFGYLAVMLIVCKSAGVLAYAAALCPLILLVPPRLQLAAAAVLAVVVVAYPLLRGLHLVPLDDILGVSQHFSDDRAYSLKFRFDNEELLLARAEERPWFGWGSFNRNFIHDPVTGENTAIADGAWVIILGIYGWTGFIADFGLTALPLLLLGREALMRNPAVTRIAAGMALILAASLLDLLPNATKVPLTWLLAGALLGEAERLRRLRRAAGAAVGPASPRTVI